VAQDPRFESDATFAESVLEILGKQYTNWTPDDTALIQSLLINKACIPSSKGILLKPGETYLKTVTLFPDLPLVQLKNKSSVSAAFLKWLGARTHVDLQVVFDRLGDLNWDHVQLIRYLVSVRSQLSDLELSRLRNTPLVPKEELSKGGEDGAPEKKAAGSGKRHITSSLYAPLDAFRQLELDVLYWPQRWFQESGEGSIQIISFATFAV
jgi:hypothetical protein